VKTKKLYIRFVDVEKAFDRVPKEVIRWAMCKLGVDEQQMSAVLAVNIVSQKSKPVKEFSTRAQQ